MLAGGLPTLESDDTWTAEIGMRTSVAHRARHRLPPSPPPEHHPARRSTPVRSPKTAGLLLRGTHHGMGIKGQVPHARAARQKEGDT